MNRNKIESFARSARTQLQEQINSKIDQILSGSNTIAYIENSSAVGKLKELIAKNGQKKVVEECAYTWFNRLCALRYMDVHHYNSTLVVSPKEGRTLPEILADAMEGIIDESVSPAGKQKILGLLSGSIASLNPQSEIYRILLVAKCNALNKELPFLFEQISDYTDLLLPDDLLSSDSIIQKMLGTLDDENCESVEVIGWLYQYYISEKKDEVFAGFKKGKKASKDEIPAATQIFTSHWIVKYMVENSVGRLWLLNHPESKLKEKMEFYIEPTQKEESFVKISDPSEFRICDPCCGSGHMLTYTFDLLLSIYAEFGYPTNEAVGLIIQNNLYGIDLDKRAGQLSYFALMMKAREKDKRFFTRGISPNVCVLESIEFSDSEIQSAMQMFKKPSLFVMDLLKQFEKADEYGSLIVPTFTDISELRATFVKNTSSSLFDRELIERINKVLTFSEYLAPRYNIVITNPPYMGSNKFDENLSNFACKNFPDSKSDFCTMFLERNLMMTIKNRYSARIIMESWKFLSSYERLRKKMLNTYSICSFGHFPYDGHQPTVLGISFGVSSFIIKNALSNVLTDYFCARYYELNDAGQPNTFPPINERRISLISGNYFSKIPGNPIAYWTSNLFIQIFNNPYISQYASCKEGLKTGNNEKFIRLWYEINPLNSNISSFKGLKWIYHTKGGDFRKWYGNKTEVLNYEDNGKELRNFPGASLTGSENFFKPCITFNRITSSKISFRFAGNNSIPNMAGLSIYPKEPDTLLYLLGWLNSSIVMKILSIINPTMNFPPGAINNIPVDPKLNNRTIVNDIVSNNIQISSTDWDSFETSWDFVRHPFVRKGATRICDTWAEWQQECLDRFNQLKANEEELNRIFIDIYGLQDELTPEEDDSDVTVRKADLARDMRSFVSYAVGCMFGRYSLNCDGLAYAGGDWNSSKYSTFLPDEDNVIPVLDDEWFNDDIVGRFKKFVRTVFGPENYDANMNFIEKALGRNIRDYFMKEFYKDHLKVYQKRPIYWMFSSPQGSFNVLVYLHRYNKDTANVVLKYMRDYRTKIQAQLEVCKRNHDPEEIKYQRIDKDLENYDSILYSLALNHIDLDLDDGVKVNYKKIGKALYPVDGLNVEKK